MKFPKVTPRRFVIVGSTVCVLSYIAYHYVTSVYPLPGWADHRPVLETVMRGWPVAFPLAWLAITLGAIWSKLAEWSSLGDVSDHKEMLMKMSDKDRRASSPRRWIVSQSGK